MGRQPGAGGRCDHYRHSHLAYAAVPVSKEKWNGIIVWAGQQICINDHKHSL